jgi:autotransporter passenger strand-loop-strand repeat protein
VFGSAVSAVISSGTQTVESGGTASATVVSRGGIEFIISGGTANATLVASGGVEDDDDIASGAKIAFGGTEYVFSGDKASGTNVEGGGSTTNTSVATASTVETISSGGEALGTSVSLSGTENVSSGGVASGTLVGFAGDVLHVADAGIGQTLTGHSHNDSFVVYNSDDTMIGQSGSTDTVYVAANFTLPTNVDTLYLEDNASLGTGNSDASNMLFGNGSVASTLVAGSGADTLYVTGTAGTIMTGGPGHDSFAFPDVMGHDEITNFGLAKDTLQFNMTLFSNFTAAMNHASQSGANTVFTIDGGETVTLDNVAKSSLTANDFHFT